MPFPEAHTDPHISKLYDLLSYHPSEAIAAAFIMDLVHASATQTTIGFGSVFKLLEFATNRPLSER